MPDLSNRNKALEQWAAGLFPGDIVSIKPISGDASFRRYFRLATKNQTFIIMDAPPVQENCAQFASLATALRKQGVAVPEVFASNFHEGFLLLSDFGDVQLLNILQENTDQRYEQAMDALIQWQQIEAMVDCEIGVFDERLLRYEFDLFLQWFLERHCKIQLSNDNAQKLDGLFDQFLQLFTTQPMVLVHRDYHSRNLMQCDEKAQGILDFQDAVWGPITYDLVSLLRDCYIDWPLDRVINWARYFYDRSDNQQLNDISFSTFMRWFDWVGLQRHLKCLGIFSRLAYRDHKKTYLSAIPRVLRYVESVSSQYAELTWLQNFLKECAYESNDSRSGSRETDAGILF